MILTCLPVEARVLAGMIAEPDILEFCDDVETDDFVDMRHVALFEAIRNAQHRYGVVTIEGIIEAIQERSLAWGSALADHVDEKFIQELIAKAPPGGRRTIRRDIERLRKDREFRRQIYEANLQSLQNWRKGTK